VNSKPDWFHHNGKGRLAPQPVEDNELTLFDSYGEVLVTIEHLRRYKYPRFSFRWKVPHTWGHTSGRMVIDQDAIEKMFGIQEDAASASRSMYVREGAYLNVPGKNCNGDGDPNLSIFVTPEIKKAVADFLASVQQPVG
jgi:hypothetical protein